MKYIILLADLHFHSFQVVIILSVIFSFLYLATGVSF